MHRLHVEGKAPPSGLDSASNKTWSTSTVFPVVCGPVLGPCGGDSKCLALGTACVHLGEVTHGGRGLIVNENPYFCEIVPKWKIAPFFLCSQWPSWLFSPTSVKGLKK